jgi:hypothetical protein
VTAPSAHNGSGALLERRLDAPPADLSPAAVAGALRASGVRACCLADAGAVAPAAARAPETAAAALAAVTAANPSYRWELTPSGLLNLFPAGSVLEAGVGERHVAGTGVWRVLEADLGLAEHGIELFMELQDGDGPAVATDLPAGTLRDALNALVAPLPGAVWDITGRPGAYFLSITAIG